LRVKRVSSRGREGRRGLEILEEIIVFFVMAKGLIILRLIGRRRALLSCGGRRRSRANLRQARGEHRLDVLQLGFEDFFG
jgi:hypothetical protein